MASKLRTNLKNWQTYRKDLREFPTTAEQNLEVIQDHLKEYRVAFAGVQHKSEELDAEIYNSYLKIESEILILDEQTGKRPLIINRLKRLENLWQSWNSLLAEQDQLLATLTDAPRKVREYDSLQTLQERERIAQTKREARVEEIKAARNSLEQAILGLELNSQERDEVTCGSEVLIFGDAQTRWLERLNVNYEVDTLDLEHTDEILDHYYRLGEVIREAPVMAKAVRAIEERFCELKDTNESLVAIGQDPIPEAELARITVMLYEKVPRLWAGGNFDELDETIGKIDKFINYYQASIDKILSIERQRRPGIAGVLALNPGYPGDNYEQLIGLTRTLVNAIDARDRYMKGHSEAVTEFAIRIARKLNWSQIELEQLEIASLLHDVGKLNIPENILTKTSPLTQHDWSIIQMHPLHSAQIVRPISRLSRIVPWVLSHQERWDGKGYPDQLSKNEIPLGASIISLSEAYTAMTTRMPNRNALSTEEALENISRESGKQFNPEVVEAFLDAMEKKF